MKQSGAPPGLCGARIPQKDTISRDPVPGPHLARYGSDMQNERGFTYPELLLVAGIVSVSAAITGPAMNNAFDRNKVFTSSELVAAQIREARLSAITRNTRYRVRFNCPDAGSMRMLEVTGDASIDNAENRCRTPRELDGRPIYLAQNVGFGWQDPPTLEIDGRGQISAIGGTMPLNIAVTYAEFTRTISVSATGRVRTPSQ